MVATVTTAQFREHQETELPDTALQRLIADATRQVELYAGDTPGATRTDRLNGGKPRIYPLMGIQSIDSVVEYYIPREEWPHHYALVQDGTTLSANDYRIDGVGRYMTRLATGDNPRRLWGDGGVDVTYKPRISEAIAFMVIVDLVKLDLEFTGKTSYKAGDYSQTTQSPDNLEKQRARVLARLRQGQSMGLR